MGLNIKNDRVHSLARDAARVTGKTQTGAIEEALELLLRAYDADPAVARTQARLDVIHRLQAACAADPGDPDREIRTVEDLYEDATGMPR